MANHAAARHKGIPWKHVVGFVLSIVLTLFAIWFALETDLSTNIKLLVIFGLAIIQAALQLLMFMHLTENSRKQGFSGRIQIGNILFGFFVAIVIVVGSVWVLSAGHAEKTPTNGDHKMKMDSGSMNHDK